MSDMILPLKRYFQFSGRSRRQEYWLFFLFVIAGSFVFTLIDSLVFQGSEAVTVERGNGFRASVDMTGSLLADLWTIAMLIPSLAVGARRLHDTERTGWWLLIGLVPLAGVIVLLIFFCLDGTRGDNRFGPDPKEPAGERL